VFLTLMLPSTNAAARQCVQFLRTFSSFAGSWYGGVCVCVMLLAGLAPAAGGAVDQVGAGECGREEGISPRRGEGE
jgi:hypothetical protein